MRHQADACAGPQLPLRLGADVGVGVVEEFSQIVELARRRGERAAPLEHVVEAVQLAHRVRVVSRLHLLGELLVARGQLVEALVGSMAEHASVRYADAQR